MVLGRRFWCSLAALSLFTSPALAAEQPIPANATLTPDPAVKRGTLENGLRYAIMRNGSPAGGVSIRLAINVGSYDETEAELGGAHFIEHMAFRSSRAAPNGILDNRFAALGIALGRDQNAVTGLDRTVYSVDLPTNRPEGIRAVLDWMRGAADGILFTPQAVDAERRVVMAEKEARNSTVSEIYRETIRFQGGGLRSLNRDPIGTNETLRAMSAATLKAFYDRWYRPDNAMLIIVGDLPAEELERAARDAFASWKAAGPAPARALPSAQGAARGMEAMSRSHPALPTGVSACRVSAPHPRNASQVERIRDDIYAQLWTGILNRRLTRVATKAGSGILNASAQVERDLPDATLACLVAMPTGDKWREALATTQAEMRRLAEAGPTEKEVEETIETMRSSLRAQVALSGTRTSPAIAEGLAEAFITGRVYQHPSDAMRAFDTAVAGITPADVKRELQEDWRGNGPLIVATAPSAPSEADLLAAWRANERAAPLEAYVDRGQSDWLYSNFGTPGKVVKREVLPAGDFVRLTFENGVIMNFKRTSYQSNVTAIRVGFGHGERALDARNRFPAGLAASYFPVGGLGKMSYEDIGSAFTNTTWKFELELRPQAFFLTTSTISRDAARELQLLTAYMTDPGFRPEMSDKIPTGIDMVYRSMPTNPGLVALDALERRLYPGKQSLPPREQMAAFTAAEFERLMKPILTRSPIEVTVVGDLSEAEAVAAVASSFGALPRRPALEAPRGPGPFRTIPATLPAPIRSTHQGPAEKAAAILLWPTWVASPERRSEEYAIELLAEMFKTRLIQRVRGEMGQAYSPEVASTMPDAADQGYLAAEIETTPADIDRVVATARQIARELASGQFTQRELDEAREPLVAERLQSQESNAAWAGLIAHSVRHPDALDELIRYKEMMAALTLADVKRAAATWLAKAPAVSIAVPGPPASAAR
jgi:zinc protease